MSNNGRGLSKINGFVNKPSFKSKKIQIRKMKDINFDPNVGIIEHDNIAMSKEKFITRRASGINGCSCDISPK